MLHLVTRIQRTKGEAQILNGDGFLIGARGLNNSSTESTSHGTRFYGEIMIRGLREKGMRGIRMLQFFLFIRVTIKEGSDTTTPLKRSTNCHMCWFYGI